MTDPQKTQSKNAWHAVNDFLDRHILPWPVRFLTFRFVILATIALLIPLIVYANSTSIVLLINSYLNTMSVAVSSIVLLYATISEIRQGQIAELQEKRAQEDHQHVTEMHTMVLQSLQNQHDEIEELKQIIAVLGGKTYETKASAPLPDLYALHPRGATRFEENDHQKRMNKQLHHNHLVIAVRNRIATSQANTSPEGSPSEGLSQAG
jgi:hypothetical protein